MAMTEDTPQPQQFQATQQERSASETATPQTAEEIALLLETLARSQADRDLAARLREWSRIVERHGQYQLRADAASIQSELYHTLEQALAELRAGIDEVRGIAFRRLSTIEERLTALEQAVNDDASNDVRPPRP
jgi:hypothetical protein